MYVVTLIIILIVIFIIIGFLTFLFDANKIYPIMLLTSNIIGLFILLRKEYKKEEKEKMKNRDNYESFEASLNEYNSILDAMNKSNKKNDNVGFDHNDFNKNPAYMKYRSYIDSSTTYDGPDELIQDIYKSEPFKHTHGLDEKLLEQQRWSQNNVKKSLHGQVRKDADYYRYFFKDEFENQENKIWWES